MKESRAYLKKNVYPKIEEITKEENKIKDSIAAQKADRKRFVSCSFIFNFFFLIIFILINDYSFYVFFSLKK